ncbi:hypothetical protein Patl1_05409 [Pistacia atlantica]|uniref:Uncharacterized protein n=1 Tax=Pistacia atlantica TaxID=434234 RepID=A0ACC1BQW2_9ROSI|nr:hypothetical protein Patl1_05409 [Pistacia atlantica]
MTSFISNFSPFVTSEAAERRLEKTLQTHSSRWNLYSQRPLQVLNISFIIPSKLCFRQFIN